ncbi:MAG: AAA family ATPase [Candidatus Heimdallarchaeota archaeon]|nr:AAA family ATPase [Candidatus Heimdallarchaeota archaeon]
MSSPIIIGVTGLPSTGKGVFSNVAQKFGFEVVVMGDVIREECAKRGLPVNRESSNIVMVKLREELGQNAVAISTITKISKLLEKGIDKILVDGIRSLPEVETFRDEFDNFLVVGCHASPKTRLQRALSRKRKDDAFSVEEFYKRDKIELSVGIGDVFAFSDIMISTDDTLENTTMIISDFFNKIIDYSMVNII